MTLKTKAILAIIPAAFLLPVLAQADSGLYVAGSIGTASLDEDFDGFNVSDDVASFRVLGGYQFGDTFGLEAGYQKFGDFEQTIDLGGTTARTVLTADGWTLGGTLGMPINESVSLFGRAGVFVWDADVKVDGIREAVDDDSNPYYGGGAKVDFTPNFSLVGDWTRYELDDVASDVISLGFEYRFGS